jgi:hypothetical protein
VLTYLVIERSLDEQVPNPNFCHSSTLPPPHPLPSHPRAKPCLPRPLPQTSLLRHHRLIQPRPINPSFPPSSPFPIIDPLPLDIPPSPLPLALRTLHPYPAHRPRPAARTSGACHWRRRNARSPDGKKQSCTRWGRARAQRMVRTLDCKPSFVLCSVLPEPPFPPVRENGSKGGFGWRSPFLLPLSF